MKRKKTKKTKAKADTKVHDLLGRLFNASDDFMLAVSGYALHKRDGTSRRMRELFERALQHAKDVRLLYAAIDPEHYQEDSER